MTTHKYVDTDVVGGLGDGSSWANAYLTLALAENGLDSDLAETMVIHCKGVTAVDTSLVVINGWTTYSDKWLEIKADNDGTYGYNRHTGTYPTNKYRLEVAGDKAIDIRENFVRLTGLAIKVDPNANTEVPIEFGGCDAGAIGHVSYCIISSKDTDGTYSNNGIAINDVDWTVYIYNNLIYGFVHSTQGRAILSTTCANTYIYNNTIFSNTIGVERVAGTVTCKNNAVFNNSEAGGDFKGTITTDYNASDDGDATNQQDFTAEATDWNKVFTSYAADPPDVSLKDYITSPCCKGVGVDDPGGGLYSDDIIGTARTTVWDIGAFEYPAATGRTTLNTRSNPLGIDLGVGRGMIKL